MNTIGHTPKLDRLYSVYMERAPYFLCNDQAAIECVWMLWSIIHMWDDLIDHDRDITDEEVWQTFWRALIVLPTNSFYARHMATLHPILVNSTLNWRASIYLERDGDERDRTFAYVMRAGYVDLMTMSALLIGGLAWATRVTPEIRRWVCEEDYAHYLDNLQKEKEMRHGIRRRRRRD